MPPPMMMSESEICLFSVCAKCVLSVIALATTPCQPLRYPLTL
jgi:hypothetical protein